MSSKKVITRYHFVEYNYGEWLRLVVSRTHFGVAGAGAGWGLTYWRPVLPLSLLRRFSRHGWWVVEWTVGWVCGCSLRLVLLNDLSWYFGYVCYIYTMPIYLFIYLLIIISSDFREGNTNLLYAGLMVTTIQYKTLNMYNNK